VLGVEMSEELGMAGLGETSGSGRRSRPLSRPSVGCCEMRCRRSLPPEVNGWAQWGHLWGGSVPWVLL